MSLSHAREQASQIFIVLDKLKKEGRTTIGLYELEELIYDDGVLTPVQQAEEEYKKYMQKIKHTQEQIRLQHWENLAGELSVLVAAILSKAEGIQKLVKQIEDIKEVYEDKLKASRHSSALEADNQAQRLINTRKKIIRSKQLTEGQ